MSLAEQRADFEAHGRVYESAKLHFSGVDGYDVYNPSIPFMWHGRRFIYGRIERRDEWSRSWVRLFESVGSDEWKAVPDSTVYQLEDPFVSIFGKTLVLGGTHVQYRQGRPDIYFGYFYRGAALNDLYYFTTGPRNMKDIRLVPLADGRIGVFSRPRGQEVRLRHGSESTVGFAVVSGLEEISDEVIENAPVIHGLFEKDEWGGCNQCYCLPDGRIGIIGHKACLSKGPDGTPLQSYTNMAFVLDLASMEAMDAKVIGTRASYPEGPAKKPGLIDCAFTAGIALRPDGKADLYSGLGDCEAGRITIDYPFVKYGYPVI